MSKWTGWVLLLCLIFFPNAVKSGVASGLELGERVLIPSIFPYLVASGILVKTGALHRISEKIKLANLSKAAKEMLIPSLFCGYPTGARLSSFAYNNGSITKKEFSLLFLFSNIPGLGFTVSYLGEIFGSTLLGFLIYFAFLLSSLTLLWYYGRKLPVEHSEKNFCIHTEKRERNEKFSEALVESVGESAQTMVSLLFFVCFFSSLIFLIKNLPLHNRYLPICASFFEITTGIFLLAQSYPVEVTVFFCGFSGLSVMFQSLYFDKKHAVNFLRLLLGRTVYGILSVCFFITLRFLFGLF